jgi:hypothetical protein
LGHLQGDFFEKKNIIVIEICLNNSRVLKQYNFWLKFYDYLTENVGQDSSVGIATHYGLDGPGIETRWKARFSAPV